MRVTSVACFALFLAAGNSKSLLAQDTGQARGLPRSADVRTGSVEGTVTFEGNIPRSQIADDAGVRRDLIEIDPGTRGLRNVVVYLTPRDASLSNSPAPTNQPPPGKPPVIVNQADYMFVPRVAAVRHGETVTFANGDPANHNVRASASIASNQFNVFTGVDGKYEHRFAVEPQYRPIRLGCDIHPWMSGWIYVFDHPYFSLTDDRGRFRMSEVPPGAYNLHIVQPAIQHTRVRRVVLTTNEALRVNEVVRRAESKQP